MRIRTLIVTATTSVVALLATGALAQTSIHQAAGGEGIARDRDGKEAKFAFQVGKVGDNPAEGWLRFGTRAEGGEVVILTDRLPRLAVRHNEARFGGPAVLRFTNAHGIESRHLGALSVVVVDNVAVMVGDQYRIVDVIDVTFDVADSDRTFHYRGLAERSSLRVGVWIG